MAPYSASLAMVCGETNTPECSAIEVDRTRPGEFQWTGEQPAGPAENGNTTHVAEKNLLLLSSGSRSAGEASRGPSKGAYLVGVTVAVVAAAANSLP